MKRVQPTDLWSSESFAGFSARQSDDGTAGAPTSGHLTPATGPSAQALLALVSNHRSFVEMLARRVARNNKNAITYSSLKDFTTAPARPLDAILIDAELFKNSRAESEHGRLNRDGVSLGLLVDTGSLTDWQVEQLVAYGPTGVFCKTDSLAQTLENIDRWMAGEVVVSRSLLSRVQVADGRCAAVNSSEYRLLDQRCREVLRLSAMGLPNKSIAAQLNVSLRTVEFHRHSIGKNLGLHNSTEMCRFAIRHGIIEA